MSIYLACLHRPGAHFQACVCPLSYLSASLGRVPKRVLRQSRRPQLKRQDRRSNPPSGSAVRRAVAAEQRQHCSSVSKRTTRLTTLIDVKDMKESNDAIPRQGNTHQLCRRRHSVHTECLCFCFPRCFPQGQHPALGRYQGRKETVNFCSGGVHGF